MARDIQKGAAKAWVTTNAAGSAANRGGTTVVFGVL